ncbi:MAG: HAMP domain-containing histidine kinase [Candidatus Thermoplasmatota archaeon]|nr:HAMP domain-containing histidine kinase [Candidatus Thermoplasmatota archaeon]
MQTTLIRYKRGIIRISWCLLFALNGWLLHASCEAVFFPDVPFLELLITNLSPQDLLLRLIVSTCFLLFGLMLFQKVSYQQRQGDKLRKDNEMLRGKNTVLEQHVHNQTQEIQTLLKQKNELIVGLSHDLNTPLTPLMGLLPLIIKQEKDPKQRELLKFSLRNLHYIRNIVSKAIDLSLLDSSIVGFTREKVSVSAELDTVLENRAYLLQKHQLWVEKRITDDLFVNADRQKLREVLNNLLMNAIQYSVSAGGVITVDAVSKNDCVIVSIADAGMGLSQEQQDQLFDALYKGDSARTDHANTGLSLPICKRIVEKHGGTIWVESPGPGKGTTVFFTLPAWKETA